MDRDTTGGPVPSLEAALTPGVVVVSAEGATELICADPEQVGRAVERRVGGAPHERPVGPFA